MTKDALPCDSRLLITEEICNKRPRRSSYRTTNVPKREVAGRLFGTIRWVGAT